MGTVSPPTINSSLSLTCSVTEGRFDWTWTRLTTGDSLTSRVLNAGRTSVLELSQLSSTDDDTYQCRASHTFGTMTSNSTNITLSLPGKTVKVYDRRSSNYITKLSTDKDHYVPYRHTNCAKYNFLFCCRYLQPETETIYVTASDDSAVLRCFLYGYFPPMASLSITWQVGNNELSNDLVYTITSEQGDMFIQNGGTSPIPSVTSTLTLNLTSVPFNTGPRMYTCVSSQTNSVLFQTITLSE